ncbi:amidase [Phialemonium atrogriseum]|uniref:Amidase n=1 Tax=Phialemonium atrogriseum TaxID=1093897 RepID=A0AAJ0C9F7_9PEZI|nr:amidase [Phialemonium atrogriseum]KAK1771977.1 amidase [Phialemonium atrogriseum]
MAHFTEHSKDMRNGSLFFLKKLTMSIFSSSAGEEAWQSVTYLDDESGSSEVPSLLRLTIEEAAEGLQSGHFTSVDLAKAYLARINEVSDFNAVLQVNPDVLSAARQLDEERSSHGIPILVKDNIATKDKLDVSANSYALLGAKPATEASVISKLRDAGVFILGKTNMSEWANFRGLNVSFGWSPRGGQTMGTYYPGSTPEGSSAGSAVATALGLSTAAIGTETFGSILEPAELNSVVGLKPTRGLIGNDGAIPISGRQDVLGPLTRTVKDAAYMLNGMAGRRTDLSGITIGVPRNTFTADPTSPIMVSFKSALKTLSSAGAKVVDNANFSEADGFKKLNQQDKGIVRSSELRRDIVQYLQTLETNPNNISSAEDIIEFTKASPAEEYPERDIGKFLWTQAEGIDVNSDKYKTMVEQERFYGGEGGILGAIDKYKLDFLIVPSSLGIGNDLAAKMGFPVLGVPLGFYPEDIPIELDHCKPNLVRVAPGMLFV